jgi:hypothetical protein
MEESMKSPDNIRQGIIGRSLPPIFLLLFLSFLSSGPVFSQGIIVDHNCTDISGIPEYWINKAKNDFRMSYGHTSHGSQVVTGMAVLFAYNSLYAYNYNRAGGALSLHDGEPAGDLGNPDRTTWYYRTRDLLDDPNSDRNIIMWSWCGQADTTEGNIDLYLSLMTQLENDYPDVKFIYMTGHLNGTGESDNLYQRNNQIRNYCIAHNKILFDFADIESYDPDGNYFRDKNANDNCDYDSDGNGSLDSNWAMEWIAANPGSELAFLSSSCGSCAHSQRLNCVLKGRAFWWMLARIAGWGRSSCRFAHSGSWTGSGPGSDGWHVGDFNGDGRDDIFRVVPGVSGADVFLSCGTGFLRTGSWTGSGPGSDGWHVGDFNGDGRDDIFRVIPGTSGADVFLSNGMRFYRSGSWTVAGYGSDGWHVGDFNGDGRDDIFRVVPGVSGADVFLSTGTGFYRTGSWTGSGFGSDGWYIGDFNGDGRDDIFRVVPGVSGADVFLSNGTRFYRSGSWTVAGHGSDGWYIGDFNGDGMDDIFRYMPGTSGADVFLSDGTRFIRSGSWTGSGHGADGWYIGDLNGDAMVDIFRVVPGVSGADTFLAYCTSATTWDLVTDESILSFDEDMMQDVFGIRDTEMRYQEEEEFLSPFMERAMVGEEVSIYEIKKDYEEAVGHPVRMVTIRQLLHRHSYWGFFGEFRDSVH